MIYLLFTNWCARCGKSLTPTSRFAISSSPVIFLSHADCLAGHRAIDVPIGENPQLSRFLDETPVHIPPRLVGYQKDFDSFIRCSILSDDSYRIGFGATGEIELWPLSAIQRIPLGGSFLYSNGPFYRIIPFQEIRERLFAKETYFLSFNESTPPSVFTKAYGVNLPDSIQRLTKETE